MILLDTHTFVWLAFDQTQSYQKAANAGVMAIW